MAANRNGKIPILRVKKGDSLKTIYAKARRAFTAADLQKYTEIEEGVPAELVAKELREIYQEAKDKRKKTRNGRPAK